MKSQTKIAANAAKMQIGKSANGTPSLNCGDVVAVALQGMSMEQIIEIATLVGMDTRKYATMNNGHKRMVIGGSLRRRVRDQDKLHVQNPQYIKSGEQWLNDLVAQVRR